MVRNFGVGIVALATIAAASLLLRRRRFVSGSGMIPVRLRAVDSLYSAGL